MKICVIDDDEGKRIQIGNLVKQILGVGAEITEGMSISAARKYLRSEKFDLLIIDIALPEFDREKPKLRGGIEFLDELTNTRRYKSPDHIIGITAHDEVFGEAAARFSSDLWSMVKFDSRFLEWQEQLTSKLQHIARASADSSASAWDVDLGIAVALRSPEFEAIMDLGWDWRPIVGDPDPAQYFKGRYKRADGSEGRAVVARAGAMGMPSAAVLATKLGFRFRPRVLCMTGICAGVRGETNLGDVVVANPTWDYGSGKWSSSADGEEVFEPSPYHHALSSRLRGMLEALEGENPTTTAIRAAFPGDKPDTITKLHVGPFASGAAVIARSKMMEWIQQQHRKLIAIDMEAHGLACAAHELPSPPPEFLVVKGVSDFADEEKGEKERRFAAYASASVLSHLAINCGL